MHYEDSKRENLNVYAFFNKYKIKRAFRGSTNYTKLKEAWKEGRLARSQGQAGVKFLARTKGESQFSYKRKLYDAELKAMGTGARVFGTEVARVFDEKKQREMVLYNFSLPVAQHQ